MKETRYLSDLIPPAGFNNRQVLVAPGPGDLLFAKVLECQECGAVVLDYGAVEAHRIWHEAHAI